MQSRTIIERVITQLSNSARELNVAQVRTLTECQIAYIGYAVCYINGVVSVLVLIPWCNVRLSIVISHTSVAADGKNTVGAEQPGNI